MVRRTVFERDATVNFRYPLQIKTAIRAMQDVVMPSIDQTNKMATEQAGLVVAMLQLLERTVPLTYRYDCDELRRSIALADELLAAVDGVPVLDEMSGKVAATAAAARDTYGRALADPGELELACREVRAAVSSLVTAAIGEAPPETGKAVMRLTISSSKEQLLRERAWTISQGWEAEPDKLPAIETLV